MRNSLLLFFKIFFNFFASSLFADWNPIPFPNINSNSPSPNLEIDLLFFIISSNVSSEDTIFNPLKINKFKYF